MKTPQQQKFEELIGSIIESHAYVIDRKGILQDFMEDSDLYYELFCDKVFQFLEAKKQGILVVDERGLVHNNSSLRMEHHIYFEILSDKDIDRVSSDIIDYINLALDHLEHQVVAIYRSVKC